jgi:hypothetical protein
LKLKSLIPLKEELLAVYTYSASMIIPHHRQMESPSSPLPSLSQLLLETGDQWEENENWNPSNCIRRQVSHIGVRGESQTQVASEFESRKEETIRLGESGATTYRLMESKT